MPHLWLNSLFSKKANYEKKSSIFSKVVKNKFNSMTKKCNKFFQSGYERRHYVEVMKK